MGAFPYNSLCRDCKYSWSGMWFSFTAETAIQGLAEANICPKCKSTNTCDFNGGKGELDWKY